MVMTNMELLQLGGSNTAAKGRSSEAIVTLDQ